MHHTEEIEYNTLQKIQLDIDGAQVIATLAEVGYGVDRSLLFYRWQILEGTGEWVPGGEIIFDAKFYGGEVCFMYMPYAGAKYPDPHCVAATQVIHKCCNVKFINLHYENTSQWRDSHSQI